MLRKIFKSDRLELGGWNSGEQEIALDEKRVLKLVGAIVYQAMWDGMLKVRIGVDSETGEAWMKYFGPVEYDEQVWWDMVPPPVEFYPKTIQDIFSVVKLESQVAFQGIIPAIVDGKQLDLNFAMDSLDYFQISWSEEFAKTDSDRKNARY